MSRLVLIVIVPVLVHETSGSDMGGAV